MMKTFLAILVILSVVIDTEARAPIWKVFCSGKPLYRGRIDSIVNPGKIAGHSHKVSGGNHFSAAGATQTPMEVYNDMIASSCTTCSIHTIDLTAYWHPDLYYQWPNKSLSLVPNGGLTVYYLSRSGSGDQANPDWKPIPKGLRMLAGDPYIRNFTGSLEQKAVNYACLTAAGAPSPSREPNNFPTDQYFCQNGLRAQVFFPMCWNGKDLDSADHKSHMAYPTGVDGGNCPTTHPVRIPGVFFEAFYSVSDFPHGQGTNPFVWSNGDPTGYGFHGDFLSGWDEDKMAEALADEKCDNGNPDMAFGNNVKACPPFAPFVQDVPGGGECSLALPIPLTEDVGVGHLLDALPGCNPLTYGPERATPCTQAPLPSKADTSVRFHLKSQSTGKYVTAPSNNNYAMSANATTLTLNEVFTQQSFAYGVSLINEGTEQYVSASGSHGELMCNRGSPNSYEGFTIVPTQGKYAILAAKNNRYLTVNTTTGLLYPTVANISNAELFTLESPDGGNVGVSNNDAPQFPAAVTTGSQEATGDSSQQTSGVEAVKPFVFVTVILAFIVAVLNM